MVVHFPIALLFLAGLVDLFACYRQDLLWEHAGFVAMVGGWLSLGAALLAGWAAEQGVAVAAGARSLVAAHERDGVVTALVVTLTVFLRWRARRAWRAQAPLTTVGLAEPRRAMKPATRRAWMATGVGYVASLVMVSVTGTLGGSLVYRHGVGLVSRLAPPGVPAPVVPSDRSSAAVKAGAQIWADTCSGCHGNPPPFNAAVVAQVGTASLESFIAQNMPPGRPVGPRQARRLVRYFESLRSSSVSGRGP
jgi:uncharacterized membrane protein